MIPSLDIIIVNWNSGNQLRDCLGAIVSCDKHGFDLNRVVVIDNDSVDDSLESVNNIAIPLVILHNHGNCGFGTACNQGVSGSSADYLLFLNPDTRVFEDSLLKPLAFLQESTNQRIGILGIQLLDEQGQILRTCSTFPTSREFMCTIFGLNHLFPRLFKSHLMLNWDHRQSREVDHVMGSFFLVRSALFKTLHGFDERYFVYLEDLDFSLRAKQAGFVSYYFAGAVTYHKGGGTSEQIKARRLFYSLRSRIQYSYKHFSRTGATCILLCTLLIEPITRMMFALSQRSLRAVSEMIIGYVYLWRNMPSILAQERTVLK